MKLLAVILGFLTIQASNAAPIKVPCTFDNGNQCQCQRGETDPSFIYTSVQCSPTNGKFVPFLNNTAAPIVIYELTIQAFQGNLQIPAASFTPCRDIEMLILTSMNPSFPHVTITVDPHAFDGTSIVSSLGIANISNVFPLAYAFRTLALNQFLSQLAFRNVGDLDLTADTFQGFGNVNTLTISQSRIKSIDDKALTPLTSLANLELSYAGLTSIPTVALNNGPSNLVALDLDGNPITKISIGDFGNNLQQVNQLYLGGTRLSMLDLSVLTAMNNMFRLSVTNVGVLMNLTVSNPSVVPYRLNSINLESSNVQYIDKSLESVMSRPMFSELSLVGDQFLQCDQGYVWMSKYATCDTNRKLITTGSFCLNVWKDLLPYLEDIAPAHTC